VMKQELLDRRKACLRLAFQGIKTTEWVEQIANEYDVAGTTVWHDWENRDEWIGEVHLAEDAVAAAKELLAEKAQVREEAWKVYKEAREKDKNAKIGALKLISQSTGDHIKLMQSLGELEKELGDLGVKKEEKINVNIVSAEDQ